MSTKTYRLRFILLILALSVSCEVWGAVMFDFMRVCLFSEINGAVTVNGEPVSGLEIIRTAELSDKVHKDKTITDKNGKFHFDAMYASSIKKVLPIEPVIKQTLEIVYQGKPHLGWRLFKHNFDDKGELDNNLKLDLDCELTREPSKKSQKIRGPVLGICSWKS